MRLLLDIRHILMELTMRALGKRRGGKQLPTFLRPVPQLQVTAQKCDWIGLYCWSCQTLLTRNSSLYNGARMGTEPSAVSCEGHDGWTLNALAWEEWPNEWWISHNSPCIIMNGGHDHLVAPSCNQRFFEDISMYVPLFLASTVRTTFFAAFTLHGYKRFYVVQSFQG